MSTLHYRITFFSPWHTSSGLSSGSDFDLLVAKDKDNLPYIPGRTLKGLIREAAEELFGTSNMDFINDVFGVSGDIADNVININRSDEGATYFGNAVIHTGVRQSVSRQDTDYFYTGISSTAIDPTSGVAQDKSLRRIETTIPCVLYGSIRNLDEKYTDQIIECLKYIKRLGLNRTRGLGRCKIEPLNLEG